MFGIDVGFRYLFQIANRLKDNKVDSKAYKNWFRHQSHSGQIIAASAEMWGHIQN